MIRLFARWRARRWAKLVLIHMIACDYTLAKEAIRKQALWDRRSRRRKS